MRIKWQGYLGKNHSWAHVAQSISRELVRKEHDVELVSTDGEKTLPEDLKPFLKQVPTGQYDAQLTYTAPGNFPRYLANGAKNRLAIWCFEFKGKNALPEGFTKFYKYCDRLIPPSRYAYEIFRESGVPENIMTMVPHGIDLDRYRNAKPYPLKTKGKFRILANIAQPHVRKNLPGLLEVFGKAFDKNEDVCLVLKVVNKKPEQQFEVSFNDIYDTFRQTYKKAEVRIVNEFITDIQDLYRSCDALFTMTHAEGFFFPGLEALAAGLVVVAPNFGGQLDYLSLDNSILIDGKEDYAPRKALYWESKINTSYFYPSVDDAVSKLRHLYENFTEIKKNHNAASAQIIEQYDWRIVTDKIMKLCV
jgi:glycosyltransferase involved in cell wall biosynthesis